MTDISGFGTRYILRASNTFPNGIEITQVADDADPLDIPQQTINNSAMSMNGQLLTWGAANPLLINLAVVPGSEDNDNLEVLADANRVARGKTPARDVITLSAHYPDGRVITATQGAILAGQIGRAVAQAGRYKSAVFNFAFESMVRS